MWEKLEEKFVKINNGSNRLRTIIANKNSSKTPLVMLHGMGSGIGLWALNLETISGSHPVYAFDILGFGRSSRPKFSHDPLVAEAEFVEAIEDWRKEVGLDKFVLFGHSFGGYLASSYAMRHPDR